MFKNNIVKIASLSALAVLVLAFCLGYANAALADDVFSAAESASSPATLGDMFVNAYNNAKPFAFIFLMIAYISGVIVALQGIHHLRLHTENPQNNPLYKALMLFFGSMCLLALPEFVDAVVESIFGSAGGVGGSMGYSALAGSSGGTGLDGMLSNFVSNIQAPLQNVISAAARISGLFMMVRGLMKASKYGFDPKTNSVHSILTNIGFGAILISSGNLDIMLGSLFGGTDISSPSALSWNLPTTVSTEFTTAVSAALTFVTLIGAIAFVRGWLIMKKVVEGGGNVTLAQGLTHILGGVLAINIGQFLVLMDKTFGTGLLN